MTSRFVFVVTLWLSLAANLVAVAQTAAISGKVVDSKTREPLPFANVFLSNTTLGTVTELNGDFEIRNLSSPAVYDLIVSFVGYKTYRTRVSLDYRNIELGEIALIPSEIELGEVKVEGKRDVAWERKMKSFERVFLGSDKAARQCNIKNPWVIDFPKMSDNTLVAKASQPVEIENRALGYLVRFQITNFAASTTNYLIQGDGHFKALTPSDDKEREKWMQAREQSYRHSVQHLFKAILDGRIWGEGFYIFKRKTNDFIDTTQLVTETSKKGVYRISFKEPVDIWFGNTGIGRADPLQFEITELNLRNGFVLVNSSGYELNPLDMTLRGVMGERRIAHLLPLDYSPNQFIQSEPDPIETTNIDFLREQIYVHTDKPYYYTGETLWFKGYVNYATPSLRDSLSRIVYVEWIDSASKQVEFRKKLRIRNGLFAGDFPLEQNTSVGTHYLRAYTNLSRNFGDDHLFIKPVTVLDLMSKVNGGNDTHQQEESDEVTLSTDKESYGLREKVSVKVLLRDAVTEPMEASFSVAVTDAKQVTPIPTRKTIIHEFPLKTLVPTNHHLARLFYPEFGLSMKGKFVNNEGKPIAAMLNVFSGMPRNLSVTQSDSLGLFELTGMDFSDSTEIYITAVGADSKPYGRAVILPDSIPPILGLPETVPLSFEVAQSPQRLFSSLEKGSSVTFLNEITVRSTKIEEDNKIKPYTYGKSPYKLTHKDLQRSFGYGNLLLSLQGRFPGLNIRQTFIEGEAPRWVVYSTRAATSSANNVKEITVLVNGVVYLGEPAKILGNLDPRNVESIEWKNGLNPLLGAQGGAGVLSIVTKVGADPDEKEPSTRIAVNYVRGYDKTRSFQAPTYEESREGEADFRSLLYWNPYLTIEKGKSEIEFTFFTSDLAGDYRIELEGVTGAGDPVRVIKWIKVEEK